MANLIIKPTSGGSLILQDEGGTAANTIDANGNTTLAGTTNNIGTVTAGTLGSAVKFPAGIMRHVYASHSYTSNTSSNTQIYNQQISITSGSKVKIEAAYNYEDAQSTTTHYSSLYFTGDTNSGIGATTSGIKFVSAMDHQQNHQSRNGYGAFVVVAPTITNPTYGVYWHLDSGSPSHSEVKTFFAITEIYQ